MFPTISPGRIISRKEELMTWRAVKIIAVISMTLDHFLKIFTVQPMLTELFGMDMAVS